MQLHAVTNQYYIITLTKNLNPKNRSMICNQIFHTCSRFHGLLQFMHLICTLSLSYTSCILRSHPSSFYSIFLLLIEKKNTHTHTHTNVAYLKLIRKISLHEQWKIELGMSRKGMQKRALSRCSFKNGIPRKYQISRNTKKKGKQHVCI